MKVSPAEAAYYVHYFLQTRILGRRRPLVGGINITSHCNLACRHCPYASDAYPRLHLGRDQIEAIAGRFREDGVRILFLQGGEPTLWHDGDYTFDQLVADMRRRFYRVACVTNAVQPITVPADLVWISVDGSPEVHDSVRGAGSYEAMAANVAASRNPGMYANVTLSRLNAADLEANVVAIAQRMPRIRGISFNFQIPYPGVKEHSLDYEDRARCVDRIVALKRRGFPILNSEPALRLMLRPGWNRTHWLIQLGHPDGTVVEGCGVNQIDPEVCRYCGYGVMAEVQAVYQGRPKAIAAALRLFRIVGG